MIATVFVAALALSDVTVTIVEKGNTNTRISRADFSLFDANPPADLVFRQYSNAQGQVIVDREPARGNVVVIADGYEYTTKRWPITVTPPTIKMIPKVDIGYSVRGECFRQRAVAETARRPDGTFYRVMRSVTERTRCDDKFVQLRWPATAPPPGFAYRLAWVETWYDADRDMLVHRPYYYLAASHFPKPCGCW